FVSSVSSRRIRSRVLLEQGVLRSRPLRCGGGVARLLRQARLGPRRCRGSAARGSPQGPVHAPTTNPARALARRNLVLAAMRGTGAIDGATYGSAVRVPLQLSDALPRGEEYGQYFKDEVRQELVKRFGEERLARGGLRVFTTLDLDMQKAAETEVQQQ